MTFDPLFVALNQLAMGKGAVGHGLKLCTIMVVAFAPCLLLLVDIL